MNSGNYLLSGIITGLASFLFALSPVPGFAQEGSLSDTSRCSQDTLYNELDEVVITATRVSRKIIDIPYSVVRLNNLDYKYERKIGANDMLSSVPGLFLQSRYGNHDVRFSIRGFGSRSNSGIRGVRILLDDIPESEPDGQTRIESIDFNSIGRIEIVKGNASSLYTNAPGGVANFINDISFDRSHLTQFNQFGSHGLWRNGLKAAVKTDKYSFLTTYSYHNYDGYRIHNQEYWHILNMVLEARPSANTSLKVLGYFTDGIIRLPGSLKKEEFLEDPYQADQRSINRDEKRVTTKGRIGIRYQAKFGRTLNHEVEVTSYGTIKYFERTSREYRIISRYGLGLSGKYINRAHLGRNLNEFSIGGDLFAQPARTEYYENINGSKGDQLLQLTNEAINNSGFFFSDQFEILPNRLSVLLTGRYDHVAFKLQEETLPSRDQQEDFNAFTPKLALNFKLNPWMAIYTSYGLSFDSPAANEMDSFEPEYLYNRDLKPQESLNFEVGIKGNRINAEADILRKILFEATLFNINVRQEIIPFEVLGDVFYRNAAETHRMGAELGGRLELIRDLNFSLAYTYSHFTYKTYSAKTVSIDSLSNIIESYADFSGNYVPSVPKHNLYLSLSYARPVVKNISAFGRVSFQGISGLWVDDANSDLTDAYSLLNGLLGLDMKFGKFNLVVSGGIDNIFDVVYVGFTNTNSADRRFYEAGGPRSFYGSVNLGYVF